MKKILLRLLVSITLVISFLILTIYLINYHPKKIEDARISCPIDAPKIPKNKKLKVMNWNVQYMAGKNYIFFYDLPDFRGKDVRPSKEDVSITINEVARIINDENPDIILFQEINEGSAQTHGEDQLAKLQALVSAEYKCFADTYYFKSKYLPQYYFGPVGMKLVVLSKYRIDKANRYALTQIPGDFISEQFGFKRAVLNAELPVEDGLPLNTMSTHLDAFSAGTNTMELQVKEVSELLKSFDKTNSRWVIAGDFNLLPMGWDLQKLHIDNQSYYNKDSEMSLLKDFNTSVAWEDLLGKNQSAFYTHLPNHPEVKIPDRTIDYFFYSKNLIKKNYFVRSKDTQKISDHLPMIFEFQL
jgi:endonuclease/exonuclease/phosphatase family metal-dependent hydrolase